GRRRFGSPVRRPPQIAPPTVSLVRVLPGQTMLRRQRRQSWGRSRAITEILVSSRERSQTDKMVDGMDFEELCSDFECISSPYVESIMRQVARDIFELREDNRAFSCYAVPVKYE
ncbi:hypothetical protein ACJX0J_040752, partial [Zea mays]